MIQILPFQSNPKDIEPSYKMFYKEKTPFHNQRNTVSLESKNTSAANQE